MSNVHSLAFTRPGSTQSYRAMERSGSGDPDERQGMMRSSSAMTRGALRGLGLDFPVAGAGAMAWVKFLAPFAAAGAVGVVLGRISTRYY